MSPAAHRFATPDGDLVYSLCAPATSHDDAPLAVCLPGMGDVRSVYRPVAERLAAQGWRVATLDLPGHGGSAAGAAPSQVRIGEAAARLVEALGGPAVAVGHSYTPDSALVAAQTSPQVRAAICLAPWAATPAMPAVMRTVAGLLTRSPYAWGRFYRSLYKLPPAHLPAHVTEVRAALRRPRGTATLRRMATGEGKDAIPLRGATTCPVAVVMGTRDPDFPDPAAEAHAYGAALGPASAPEVVMAEGVGHYPHAETPDLVTEVILATARRGGIVAGGAGDA